MFVLVVLRVDNTSHYGKSTSNLIGFGTDYPVDNDLPATENHVSRFSNLGVIWTPYCKDLAVQLIYSQQDYI